MGSFLCETFNLKVTGVGEVCRYAEKNEEVWICVTMATIRL